jgi:outer membrane protein OmpA-like peptidoglycan-associated protein
MLLVAGCKSGKSDAKRERVTSAEIAGIAAPIGGKAGIRLGKVMAVQKDTLAIVLGSEATVEAVNRDEALRLTFGAALLFEANSNMLNSASQNILFRLAAHIREYSETDILIVGHTDRTGVAEYNSVLSERRARSVYDRLAALGVSPARMDYRGKGGSEPAGDNATAEGRTRNRRIELFIVPNEKMIGDAREKPAK